MKKIITLVLSGVALLTASVSSFGQGQFVFNNAAASAIYLDSANTVKMFGPANTYTFGLYMGAFGSTALSQMTLVDTVGNSAIPASTFFTAGLFAGGTVASPGNVANGLNFQAGVQYAFMVAGWTTASGSTYAQAAAAAGSSVGVSALGFITPLAAPATAPNIFGAGAGQVGSFNVVPAPEPSTIALGGLGIASLLLFRRRKK